jgi:hypothetical protein
VSRDKALVSATRVDIIRALPNLQSLVIEEAILFTGEVELGLIGQGDTRYKPGNEIAASGGNEGIGKNHGNDALASAWRDRFNESLDLASSEEFMGEGNCLILEATQFHGEISFLSIAIRAKRLHLMNVGSA